MKYILLIFALSSCAYNLSPKAVVKEVKEKQPGIQVVSFEHRCRKVVFKSTRPAQVGDTILLPKAILKHFHVKGNYIMWNPKP